MSEVEERGVVDVDMWKPARKFPQTYPGDRPPTSYLLLGDRVHPVDHHPDGNPRVYSGSGRWEELDAVLRAHGTPTLENRYRVLAYGANRNPATLHTKLKNYTYRPDAGAEVALPALRVTLPAADIVACGLSGQGYLYGDLLIDSPATAGTHLEAWLLLLDIDQLRVLNDSEGIRTDLYSVGLLDGVVVDGTETTTAALCYVANATVLTSPRLGTPLSFSAVEAVGRTLPSMTPIEMLAHLIDAYGMAAELAAVTGIPGDGGLAAALMKYLNGQWWYAFNTGDAPIEGYIRVLDMFAAAVGPGSLPSSTAAYLGTLGRILSTADAYAPAVASGPFRLGVR